MSSCTHEKLYEKTHSTSTVRTCLGREDILAGPRNFKGLFEGQDLVLLSLELGLGWGKG